MGWMKLTCLVQPRCVKWLAAAAFVLGGGLGGGLAGTARAGGQGDYAFFDALIDVKVLLEAHYVEDPDDAALRDAAIRAMVEALDDPYTTYVPARDRGDFEKSLSGRYVGIGAQVALRDGWLVIVTPLEGSPALRAGVMAGDRVTEIDGEGIFGKSTDECIELLQGEPGTTVVVTVERGGETLEIPIERARIQTLAVKGFHRASDAWQHVIDPGRRIAYVRLTQFTPGCANEVRAALEGVMEGGAVGGLVLDLRWNPGGLLSEAGAIADMFLDSGVIVSTRGRSVPEEVLEARSEGTLGAFPIAVLVNGGSASASEVLSGALQDQGRAVVVGTRTFGKGSVQSVRPLPRGGGAQLKVTEQRYYLPSGRSIHRMPGETVWGVDPDEGFWVEMTGEQTRAMLEVRRAEEIIDGLDQGADVDWSDTDAVLGYLRDPQLEAAVRAVQGRVDRGVWTATGEAKVAGNELAAEELARLRLTRERVLRELTRLDARLDSLKTASAGAEAEALRDLWPDDAAIEGGRVEVVDAEGRVVRTLRITGPDLERWLIDADVEVDSDDADDASGGGGE